MKGILFAVAATCALIVSVPCWARDVPASEITSQGGAEAVCPGVCRQYGGWNRNWTCRPNGPCVCGCNK